MPFDLIFLLYPYLLEVQLKKTRKPISCLEKDRNSSRPTTDTRSQGRRGRGLFLLPPRRKTRSSHLKFRLKPPPETTVHSRTNTRTPSNSQLARRRSVKVSSSVVHRHWETQPSTSQSSVGSRVSRRGVKTFTTFRTQGSSSVYPSRPGREKGPR